LIFGLKEGCTRAEFERLLSEGRLEECLNSIKVKRGDTLFVSPGTIHAIGEGIVLAEIQQSSDLTYRVYDWNRVGQDGKPRELHIEHALNVISFGSPPPSAVQPRVLRDDSVRREELIRCDKFILERILLRGGSFEVKNQEVFEIVSVISGSGELSAGGAAVELGLGESLLLPAALGGYRLSPAEGGLEVLRSWVP